jgi:UDP-glucuronate 4-epimerase
MTAQPAVVTGCAGFIGSHLAERLVGDGWHVLGVDAFTPYYSRADKEANLATLTNERRFDFLELDVADSALIDALPERTTIFHLAAQPGVRGSFGAGFADYVHDNVLATQRVFEAALERRSLRVVWASSSSVYGDAETYPCIEDVTTTRPRSPYGVTKRACEDLAEVYRLRGLSTVGLRYFTVYGPRQRPDMATRRLCHALVEGTSFPINGDGLQSRDFTHVADAVDATVRAAVTGGPHAVYNVGGGEEASLAHVIAELESIGGRRIALDRREAQAGDVRRTGADTSRARETLGWRPQISLRNGLRSELNWVAGRIDAESNEVEAGASLPVWRERSGVLSTGRH